MQLSSEGEEEERRREGRKEGRHSCVYGAMSILCLKPWKEKRGGGEACMTCQYGLILSVCSILLSLLSVMLIPVSVSPVY
jgi:hypothetical protein